MRIIFMGTPEFAVPTLRRLYESEFEVVGVVTSPDRPAGRGLKLRPSPVKRYASGHEIPVLQPPKLRDPEFIESLVGLKPDLAVVVAFRMLPEMVWSVPGKGTLNLHASLLPDYRGAAPINWVLINGETETGATTFFIDRKIDTGDLLLQTRLKIPFDWTAGDLHDHLMESGAELVLETVRGIAAEQLEPKPQDPRLFKHKAPKIFPEDCQIDWSRDTFSLHNFVRGLSPYPCAYTYLDGVKFKVYRAKPAELATPGTPAPGEPRKTDDQLFVGTGDGWLELLDVQLAGKKRMQTGDFLRGYKGNIEFSARAS